MSPLVIVVVVLAGEAGAPWVASMTLAARSGASSVVVEELPALDEAGAMQAGARDHANAVAIVSWGADHSRATLRVHSDGEARWVDRAVAFQASDLAVERGRTLGFALASMLPVNAPQAASPPPTAPEARPNPSGKQEGLPDRPLPRVWHGAVDAVGHGAVALGGYGGGVGASLAAHWYFVPRLSARLGLGIRSGEVPPAQATSLLLTGSLGLGFRWLEPGPRQPFGLGARVALIAMWQSLTHLSADDTSPATASRWMPGAELMLEGALHFAPSAAVLLGVGTEVAMGETRIDVGDRVAATLAPWRLVGELGLRARF